MLSSPENLKIVAVGGKAPDGKAASLLEAGLDLTGKEKSNVLIIPTAKHTQETYDRIHEQTDNLYADKLGLPTQSLHQFNSMPDETVVDELLEWADLVYIAGGDTKRMMEIWQRYGIDTKLKLRAMGGLVLTGISAGAIAPFEWGHSDWEHYYPQKYKAWKYRPVDALGLINAAITPHNDSLHNDRKRQAYFRKMFSSQSEGRGTRVGFGLDNFAGIKINDGRLEMVTAAADAGAVMLDSSSGRVISSKLDANQPIKLSELGL